MIDKIADRISERYVLVSLTLLLALGLFMMGVYAPWFSARAGGQPYMETKLGYLPGDLFEMAEAYETERRTLYIRTSLTLDFLIPLMAGNFLIAFSLYLLNKLPGREKWRKPLVVLGVLTALSDWMENALMIGLLSMYPKHVMALAIAARVMTSVKYLLMLTFIIIFVEEFWTIKKPAGRQKNT